MINTAAARASLRSTTRTVATTTTTMSRIRKRPASSFPLPAPMLAQSQAHAQLPLRRTFATAANFTECCNKPGGCEHNPAGQQHQDTYTHNHTHTHTHNHDHGTAAAEADTCWACGRPMGCCKFFCDCGKIQPVVGHCSYFDTFHLPRAYDLDVKALEKTFFDLQKDMHPDRYGQKSRTERDVSASNSTYLNGAYRTLKDPTLRAKYLLKLEGISALDEKSKTADPALLMEIMDLREQVEEAHSARALRELMKKNREAILAVKKEIAQVYREKAWPRMVALTNRLQYLSKVEYEAREKLDLFEDEEEAKEEVGRNAHGKEQHA